MIQHLWQFDEGGGDVTYDSVGDASGYLTGTWDDGVRGSAISIGWDGENEVGKIEWQNLNLTSASFSILCWFKTIDNFYALRGDTDSLFLLLSVDPNPTIRFGKVGGNEWSSNYSTHPSLYQHAAVTYDGNTLKMYLNGVLDSEHVIGETFSDVPPYLTEAGLNNSWLDDLQYYDNVVSAKAISRYYENQGNYYIEEDEIPLFIGGTEPTPNSGELTLFLQNDYTVSSGELPLFIEGGVNNWLPLYTHGHDISSGAMPLLLYNNPQPASGELTLFLQNDYGAISGEMPLYLEARQRAIGAVPLYTRGILGDDAHLTLSVRGPYPFADTSSLDLSLYGTDQSGVFAAIPLHIHSESADHVASGSLPLYLDGPDSEIKTSTLNLVTPGAAHELSASLDLFMLNSGTADSITLYVRGLGEATGSVPYERSMNLFIRRKPAASIDLYIASWHPTSSGLPLLTVGASGVDDSIDLVIPNTAAAENDKVLLYTHGF